jgi:hypothetical protein
MAFADQSRPPDTPLAQPPAARGGASRSARHAASRARVNNAMLAAAIRELRTHRRRIESSSAVTGRDVDRPMQARTRPRGL